MLSVDPAHAYMQKIFMYGTLQTTHTVQLCAPTKWVSIVQCVYLSLHWSAFYTQHHDVQHKWEIYIALYFHLQQQSKLILIVHTAGTNQK